MKLSRTFFSTLKLHPRPAYEIAQLANVDPNWVSKALHGMICLREDDERLIRIAQVLGLSENQIFEDSNND